MIGFLFPGQGSQAPGMAKDFYDRSPAARTILDTAASVAGDELLRLMFDGPAERLRETQHAQAALVAAGIAIAAHLTSCGVRPSCVAGHSIGEIAALAVAGSLDPETALSITLERGRVMSDGIPEGAMAAVLGCSAEVVQAALPEGVEVANFNGPLQTIISGSHEALERASAALSAAGARKPKRLEVSGPFHSSYMRAASESFRKVVAGIAIYPPRVEFVSSVTGKAEQDPETIRELLWRQIDSPVRWTDVMRSLRCDMGMEAGPGKALQGIAKRIEGAPRVESVGTLEGAEAICARFSELDSQVASTGEHDG